MKINHRTSKKIIIYLFGMLQFIISTYGFSQTNPHSTPARWNEMKSTVQQSITNHNADNALWAISVRDTNQNLLFEYNGNQNITPASNLKLLTSAAILDALGHDFRFQTHLFGKGTLLNHTWHGDIYIVGAGDPSISKTFYQGDMFYVFERFWQQLDGRGIQTITGDIIANDAYFDDIPYPDGWEWNDLPFYYAPEINALSFNENCVDLDVKATPPKPKITWQPDNTNYVNFINEQTIKGTRYKEDYRRMPGTNTILLRSQLPQGYHETESLTITNPALFFVDSFYNYLQKKGITCQGKPRLDTRKNHLPAQENLTGNDFILLATHQSNPLSILIKPINKRSHNFFTEMLVKTVGAEKYQPPGSTKKGLQYVQNFAIKMGFNSQQLVLQDGSGLSRANLICTNDMTQFLINMRNHPEFQVFEQSLSVAGVDGSLENRFRTLRGKIKGKSGYVSGVRSHSGYLTTAKNQIVAFSIITNYYTNRTSTIDKVHQEILELIFTK